MRIDEIKKEYRKTEPAKLAKKLSEKKDAYIKEQMQDKGREKKNPGKLKKLKKEIAVISTIIREELEDENENKE